jgi:hypothetical protein
VRAFLVSICIERESIISDDFDPNKSDVRSREDEYEKVVSAADVVNVEHNDEIFFSK